MDQHDRFIIGSLASTVIACTAGNVAGVSIVFGAQLAVDAVGCFGIVALIAFPAGFILAFALMPSPHRLRWLLCWSVLLGTISAVVSWRMASAIANV